MKFDTAEAVDQICYQMRLADWPRGQNRARINDLFNGFPPYSQEEVEENEINVNVNDLSAPVKAHDARSQFYSAFLKPGNYFRASTDMGVTHKRKERSDVVTREVNRIMKRSLPYFECFRSRFALDVLHGIGPAVWEDRDMWCNSPIGIEDVLVPARTYLTMKNLPFIAIFRSWTGRELIKLTSGPQRDPGWKMPLVRKCLEWLDRETMQLMGSNWPEIWSPEKAAERVKGDGGFYMGDQAPTIDAWDFYFWDDDSKQQGWKRRMILDAWSTPANMGASAELTRKQGDLYSNGGEFLFNPGNRIYASKREELVSFQFADLSAVAPFQYHSVRSLGFLLYAVCHLQNRLKCKFNEAVFEGLMMYFRVKGQEDVQRVLKTNLINKGFIDESLQFVPASERFQLNSQLVELGLQQNQQIISENSASYVQNQNFSRDRTEKTKFQVMAEVNSQTSLTSVALMQAYEYQKFDYYEHLRRFFKKNSRDPDVREFQARVLKRGVPDKLLTIEAWDLEPERTMGGGNKTMEMAIAGQLMEYRNLYDPEPQRQILRDVTLAITDDPARADSLVPPTKDHVSDAKHDAQMATGSLMMGFPVDVKTGLNHIDWVETLMKNLAMEVKKATDGGNMASQEKITGMQNLAKNIGEHIQIIGQDKNEKQRVAKYQQQLTMLMNLVKGFQQRLIEQMKKAQKQNGNGQMDPKDQAKIQATMMMAQTDSKIRTDSAAQRTAQKQLQFQQKMQQDHQKHQAELAMKDLETATEIHHNRLKSLSEEGTDEGNN